MGFLQKKGGLSDWHHCIIANVDLHNRLSITLYNKIQQNTTKQSIYVKEVFNEFKEFHLQSVVFNQLILAFVSHSILSQSQSINTTRWHLLPSAMKETHRVLDLSAFHSFTSFSFHYG